MAGDNQFERQARTRVGGPASAGGRWARRMIGAVVLLAAGFLVTLVWAGSLDAPPDPPTAIAALPPTVQPTPPLRPSAERLYLATVTPASTQIEARNADDGQLIYTIAGGRDLALSPDGTLLFVAHQQHLSAHDAASGAEIWRSTLRGIAEPTRGGPPTLLVAPDGGTVSALMRRRVPDGSQATYPTLLALNAQTGRSMGTETTLSDWNGRDAPFFSPGGTTVYVAGSRGLLALTTGAPEDRTTLHSGTVAVFSAPDRRTIYALFDTVISGRASIEIIPPDDLASRETAALDLAEDTRITPLLALSPDGRTLVVRALLLPTSATALRMSNTLVVFDLLTRRTLPAIPLAREATVLGFGPQTGTLYLAQAPVAAIEGDTLLRLPEGASTPTPIVTLPEAAVTRLLAGPARPPRPTSPSDQAAPQIVPLPERFGPPTLIYTDGLPLPGPTFELTSTDPLLRMPTVLEETGIITIRTPLELPRPSAWLSLPNADGFAVLTVGADGTTTLGEPNIRGAIVRPSASPLLLTLRQERWQIVDPLTAITTPLPFTSATTLRDCVLAPDGAQIACQTAPTALNVIDLASGGVRTLASGGQLAVGVPLAWSANGLYGITQIGGLRWLWRTDPLAGNPDTTFQFPLDGRDSLSVSASSARFAYTQHGAGELRLHDLNTNADRLIYFTRADLTDRFALSANGQRLAYIRPTEDGQRFDLAVAEPDRGDQRLWVSDISLVPGSLRWNQAGDHLLYRTVEPPDSPQRERLHIALAPEGLPILELALPGDTVVDADFTSDNRAVALIAEQDQPSLILAQPKAATRVPIQLGPVASRPTLLYVP